MKLGVLIYLSGDDTSFTWVDEILWNEILVWHAKLCLCEITEGEFQEAVGYMCMEDCQWSHHHKNPAPARMLEHVITKTYAQTWVLMTADITGELIGLLTIPI